MASEKKVTKEKLEELSKRRFCYVIPPDGYVAKQGFRVSIVFEFHPGHFPTGDWPYEGKPGQTMPWFWGHNFEAAVSLADEANLRLGLDQKTAAIIVASSMGSEAAERDTRPSKASR